MTFEIGLLLGVMVVALIFFSFEKFSADVVALGLLVVLVLTRLLPANKAFAGFGSDTVVLVFGLLVLTAAMERTGVMEMLSRNVLRYTGTHPKAILILILLTTTVLSAFMSNTASTAFFLPIVIGLARRTKVPASGLLMPLAFASIGASALTLISTSTNIVINGLMMQYQLPPMGVFELTPLGIPIALAVISYMFFIGRRLIPNREPPNQEDTCLGERPYHTEVLLLPNSPWAGKTIEQAALGRDLDLHVTQVVRNRQEFLPAQSSTKLQAGDILLVEGLKEHLLQIRNIGGLEIKSDVTLSEGGPQGEELAVVEVILLPGHWMVGRSLESMHFRQHYALQVLGIHRNGKSLSSKLGQVSLRVGDILLLQGERDRITSLEADGGFRVLGAVEEAPLQTGRWLVSIGIFVGALALGTVNLVSLPVAVIIGVVLVFLTRCLSPEEAYRSIEWKVLILIGSMLGLGAAMESTGAAKYLAGLVVQLAGQASPEWLLGGFFVFTVLLTQPMSNQAAAVVVLPVALQTAMQLGLNPRSFAMIIAMAASCSFITPLEPSCLMVYGPGRYRFMDFVKVGLPLTFIILAIALWLVPRLWPL